MSLIGSSTITWGATWNDRVGGEIIRQAAAAGLDVLEIPLLDPTTFDAALHRRQLADAGLHASLGTGLPPGCSPTTNPGAALDCLRRAIDITAELGAVVLSGVLYGTIGEKTGAPVTARERGAMVDVLRAAARHALDAGVTLGIEPLNRYESHLCTTIAEACSLITATGAENIRVCPDTFHMNIEEASWRDSLGGAGRLLGHLQVADNDRSAPGCGAIDFAAVFQALAEIEFRGALILESFAVSGPGFPAASYYREPSCTPQELLGMAIPFLRDAAREASLG